MAHTVGGSAGYQGQSSSEVPTGPGAAGAEAEKDMDMVLGERHTVL